MIFKQWEQVLGLTLPLKSQTRRVNCPYELAVQLWKHGWSYPRNNRRTSGGSVYRPYTPWDEWQKRHPITDAQIAEANRILAEHVVTLPVQPGRGKKSMGRIRITKIRRERLQDIKPEEFRKEGLVSGAPIMILWFIELWSKMYRKPYRWEDNPDVWVLEFELVKGSES
ncbi:MAG TPA: hypothetical protein VMW79_10720 [Anaerolineae bacterium]|nr:hypothetical protein [Anaerolineae bacterium]